MKNLLRAIALALALGIAPMGGALAQDKGGPAAEIKPYKGQRPENCIRRGLRTLKLEDSSEGGNPA